MKIFKTECLLDSKLPNTQSFQRKLATNLFSVVLPASGLISFQQSLIESNKLNFMMKQHFDFLPTKSELAAANNN